MRRPPRSASFSQRAASAVARPGREAEFPDPREQLAIDLELPFRGEGSRETFASRETDFSPRAAAVAAARRSATRRSCRPSGSPRRAALRALLHGRDPELPESPAFAHGALL